MTTQTQTMRGGPLWQLLAAGGMGMALVVLVGLVGWITFSQAGPGGGVPPGPTAVPADGRTAAVVGPGTDGHLAARASADEFIYLVSTPAQADALRAEVADGHVVVWDSEEGERLLRVLTDMAPPGVRLVDRRIPAQSAGLERVMDPLARALEALTAERSAGARGGTSVPGDGGRWPPSP